MIAVITPWRDALHLLPAYAAATAGAVPVILDSSADPRASEALSAFCAVRGGVYLRHEAEPFSYGGACNRGLDAARRLVGATHAVCLNNDVEGAPAWLEGVAALPDGVLAGPELVQMETAGQPHLYVGGWCVAATIKTWDWLRWWTRDNPTYPLDPDNDPMTMHGPWDATHLRGSYHEDVDLSWRAARAGVYLRKMPWALRHLGEQTARVTPGATAHHAHNRGVFEARVRAWQEARP